ncbi:uncharacterized protein FPRO_03501 [Fusarium proliferatum ET1]|uniref:Uncharacterized protein n=1 Tax=Fusarium proliferatum (strain ET1) TaxID=1227346 RepID=A0A1L7V5W8_FUSPR|nr:uncharacterized protein FPRO_03501 [Fusarium proliferatum ET1]CZR36239.1 uncharacterized protein FPRO_03501 [Fusarium proliferatum ET1]
MGRGDLPSVAVGEVFDENQQIMDLVEKLTAEKQQSKAQLQRVLHRIYKNIAAYGEALDLKSSVEAYVYDGWRGLLNPIKVILKLPGTDFYEGATADEELADLYELCTEIDDVLLGALRTIWIRSGQTESFEWVFADHLIGKPLGNFECWDAKIAVCLSLDEYKRRFKVTRRGERYYYSELTLEGDRQVYAESKLYKGPKPRWDLEEGTGLNPEWKWRVAGNARPIAGDIKYTFQPLATKYWDCYVCRRSWQFCLDAQQIAEANLGTQRQELLNDIWLRHHIPREIQREILSYLPPPHREPFPYLKNLDIGAAYTPFPTVGERCLDCENMDEDSAIRRTCPQASLYTWNFALRCFHSFHKNELNQWSLCSHGSDCKGHHNCSDHRWAVLRDPEFSLFIEKEASRGNDQFISLDQIGLGPVQHIRLNKAEDEIRSKRLKNGSLIYFETHRDWEMTGGLGGLVDSMLHGGVLTKAWSQGYDDGGADDGDDDQRNSNDQEEDGDDGDGDDDEDGEEDDGDENEEDSEDDDDDDNGEDDDDGRPREAGTRRNRSQWALGRSMLAQSVAEKVVKDLHSWPGRCEWCE